MHRVCVLLFQILGKHRHLAKGLPSGFLKMATMGNYYGLYSQEFLGTDGYH